jgi:hypothetical protein
MNRGFVLAGLLVSMLFAGSDPFAGVWRMNVRRSKYPQGAAPKQMVIRMEPAGDGIHYRSEATSADGKVTQADYVADYTGKAATVKGTVGIMIPVSLQRPDANTVVASYTRGGEVIATSRRSLSKDGRVMTITTVSKDRAGHTVTNIGVYEKTAEPVKVE